MISVAQPERRVFGQVAYTEHGTRCSAYVLNTGKGFVAVGALPEPHTDEWLSALLEIAGDQLTNAVFLGTDSDRTAIRGLLVRWPAVRLALGSQTLAEISAELPAPVACTEIRAERTLELDGRSLRFIPLPGLSDARGLCVVDPASRTLFVADLFGSLYGGEEWRVSEMEDKAAWLDGARDYMGEIDARHRQDAMEWATTLIKACDIAQICPVHGPVIDVELEALSVLRAPEPKPAGLKLAVVFAPGRYVREMAKRICLGAREAGVANVVSIDLAEVNRRDVLEQIIDADAWLFGTPEINGDAAKPIWDVVTSLTETDCAGKTAAVFCSSAVQGKTAFALRQRFAQLGCDLNLNDFFVQGIPDGRTLDNMVEYGFHAGCYIQKIPNPRKPTLVMCLVCGEIFDASLGACPVCGVGLDQCVPVEADETAFRNDTQSTYLILGVGVAAVSAAEAIRLRDRTGSITMLSAEACLPINRPMLTKDFAAIADDPAGITMRDAVWFKEKDIDLRLGIRAVRLLPEERAVLTDTGERFGYDKLVYAAGAECFIPPFEGHDKTGVLAIRHLEDNLKLQKLLETAENAVVIGGGVLGLEAASEIMRAGVRVTVLEATPQIVGRQIDAVSAAILRQRMEKLGVPCYEGVSIAAIEGGESVSGVRLADGRVFPADAVVVSCGNRTNIDVAREAGAQVERAIVVDERMRTSLEDVYACGDCAQFENVNFQQWQEATAQGRVAGANAAGEAIAFANKPAGLSLDAFGFSLYAIGDAGKREGVPYKIVELSDGVSGRHEKYWFLSGELQGAVLIDAPWKVAQVADAVATHAMHEELFGEE